MTKKTLRLATTRSTTPAAPARKAGVRMVRSRIRAGEGPEAPVRSESRKARPDERRAPRADEPRAARPEERGARRPDERRTVRPEERHPRRPGSEPGQSRPWSVTAPPPAGDSRGDDTPRRRRTRESVPGEMRQPPRRTPPPVTAAVATSPPGHVRVSRLLAEQGLCSRREADDYIAKGWVWADGVRVTRLGTRVATDAVLRLDQQARAARVRLATILLHKPVGHVSGQPEDDHPPAVALIRPENLWEESPPSPGTQTPRFDPAHLRGLAPAGRLDIDSTGLLVLTQDGTVARRLIGADSDVDKEYLVRVEGELVAGGLERLRHGLELDGEALRQAEVEWLNADQLRFVLREGRKRQIRRMCEQVGLRVTGLKRVRIGKVPLGDLPPGRWRYLGADETF